MPLNDCEFAEAIREKWGAAPEGAPDVDARQELAAALGLDLPDLTPFPKID